MMAGASESEEKRYGMPLLRPLSIIMTDSSRKMDILIHFWPAIV